MGEENHSDDCRCGSTSSTSTSSSSTVPLRKLEESSDNASKSDTEQIQNAEMENAVSSIAAGEGSDEKLAETHRISQGNIQLLTHGMVNFVASSDAACSAVSMVDAKSAVPAAIFGGAETSDSNDGFELIDEGRIEGMQNSYGEAEEEGGANAVPERDIHEVQVCA